jgi:hypothetical protein
MAHKDFKDPADFWREYEEKLGEKILAYGLGRLVSGWEFTLPLWGLLIAADGGFHFHHFPQQNWLLSILRAGTEGETVEEKTLFIPKDKIISSAFKTEKSVLKRLFFAVPPRLVIRYWTPGGGEAELVAEADNKAEAIAGELRALAGRDEEKEINHGDTRSTTEEEKSTVQSNRTSGSQSKKEVKNMRWP